MANFNYASPEIIEIELAEFNDWLIAHDIKRNRDYISNLRKLDKLSTELGYEVSEDEKATGSILSLIIGRVRDTNGKKKKDLKVAVGLALLIKNKLETYRKGAASGASSLPDVSSALNNYVRFLLNIERKHKIDNEDRYTKLATARRLAGNISLYLKKNELRNSLKKRLTTEDRGLLKFRKIHDLLSGHSDYVIFLDKLISRIIFYAYDFINDIDYKKPIKFTIKDIQKLHIEKEGLCFVVDNDERIYRLLTPTFPGDKLRPALGYKFEEFHIDHEPAISNKLKEIVDSIPNIVAINDMKDSECSKKLDNETADLIVKELELIHEGIELRMMEDAENRKKSDQ